MLFATGCAKLRRCSNTHSHVSLDLSCFHGPIAAQFQESVVFLHFPNHAPMENIKNTSCFTTTFASCACFVMFLTLAKITIYMQCKLKKAEASLS
jgi:hypothetical protein